MVLTCKTLQFIVVVSSVLIVRVAAGGYGSRSQSSGNYGGMMSSHGMSSGGSAGNGYGSSSGQVVQAAVNSRHEVKFYDVPSTGSVQPTTIEVG